MKKLVSYDDKAILNFIYTSENLTSKFSDYVIDCEMDFISDKLSVFSSTSANWSVGVYNHNYFRFGNPFEFLQSVEKSIQRYGCTDDLQKLKDRCDSLYYSNSNLFRFYIEKLCDMYYQRVVRRSTLCRIYFLCGSLVGRICTKSVYRLGGKSNQAAVFQYRCGGVDSLCIG